jgi:hypothetical protein
MMYGMRCKFNEDVCCKSSPQTLDQSRQEAIITNPITFNNACIDEAIFEDDPDPVVVEPAL